MDRDSPRSRPPVGAARLAGMFVSPGATLAGLARSPSLALVLLATALAGGLEALAVSRASDLDAAADHAARQAAENMPGSTEADEIRPQIRESLRLTRVFAPVLGALGAVIAPAVAAAWFLLVFGVTGTRGSYRLLLALVAHAGWPAAATGAALTTLIAWLSHPVAPDRVETLVRTSVASWLPAAEGVARAVLFRVDLLLGWEIALTAMGFAAVLAISRRRALVVALSLWLVVTLLAASWAALAASIGFRIGAGPA